jgi:glycosyltransferase involved in cell wall biosynthesis
LIKNILLLSGYDAASHRYWRNLLVENLPQFNWTQLALPDRHFSWRIRGNSLNFAFQFKQEVSRKYDLVIATSMVDLASLIGLVPQLGQTPSLVYFHENQFVYPSSSASDNANRKANEVSAQLTSIYTALAATRVLFNSEYNRSTFLSGVSKLLKRLPDKFPKQLVESIENRSQVLAVPIKPNLSQTLLTERQRNVVPHIVWNHRWEYDKQPNVFFDALKLLKQSGYQFKLHILGQAFREVPECFYMAEKYFENEILTFGFQSRASYQEILNTSDIVVSSALHDFQGLSLMEAINSGCIPVAPNRVAYPEYVSKSNLYSVDDVKNEAFSLFNQLKLQIGIKEQAFYNLTDYESDKLIPEYLEIIESIMNNN